MNQGSVSTRKQFKKRSFMTSDGDGQHAKVAADPDIRRPRSAYSDTTEKRQMTSQRTMSVSSDNLENALPHVAAELVLDEGLICTIRQQPHDSVESFKEQVAHTVKPHGLVKPIKRSSSADR